MNWKLISTLLACFHAVKAFNCPEDSHPFYHADVSTGCQVYHHCENSELHTFTCPSGEAFNHETSSCEDASTVNCYETMGDHTHHHHKRSIEEHHTIDIQEFRKKVKEAYLSIRPIVKEALRGIAPSIYAKFEDKYLPSIQAAKEEVLPFFYEKVYPEVRKWLRYSIRMSGKLLEKVYRSYELSNSTHVTVVSISDLAEQVSNDLEPVLRLGRFLSAKMLESKDRLRNKREVTGVADVRGFIDFILEPLVESLSLSIREGFLGKRNAFVDKVIVPTFYEMVSSEATRDDALSVLMSAKTAFTPVVWEMLKRQTSDTPRGTIVRIPKETYTAAVDKFVTEIKPKVQRMTYRHLRGVFIRLAENRQLIEEGLALLEAVECPHVEELRTAVMGFVAKHGGLLLTSSGSHVEFFPLAEILEDLRPVRNTLLKIFLEFYDDQNFWLRSVFEDDAPSKKEVYKYVKSHSKLSSKKSVYAS